MDKCVICKCCLKVSIYKISDDVSDYLSKYCKECHLRFIKKYDINPADDDKNYFTCECGEKVKFTKHKLDSEKGMIMEMSDEEIENFRHNKKCTDCVEEEDDKKRRDLLQKLSDKCDEISTMKQELRIMEHDIEKSYPEFNEPDDKPRRKSQSGSAYWFNRHLHCLHDLRLIEDHKKKISDLIKEKDKCRQLYLDEYGEFLHDPEERIRLQLLNKVSDKMKELHEIKQMVQYLEKEIQDCRDFYKDEYGEGMMIQIKLN